MTVTFGPEAATKVPGIQVQLERQGKLLDELQLQVNALFIQLESISIPKPMLDQDQSENTGVNTLDTLVFYNNKIECIKESINQFLRGCEI